MSAAWYALPGAALLVALAFGGWAVVTVLAEKSRDTLGDMISSQPPSASADLSAGTRYRIKVIGSEPSGRVTCAFVGPAGTFRLRFPPMPAAEHDKIASTLGLFTAPRDGRFEVSCSEAGASGGFDDGRVYGIRVRRDYATDLRTQGLVAGTAGLPAVASWAVVFVLRRRTRTPRAGRS